MTEDLPDKIYFKVGEVSRIAGVPAYVLRFWEREFASIRPKRAPSGQRLYRKRDIRRILAVKQLLYERGFTIEGAKRYLKAKAAKGAADPGPVSLAEIHGELESIRKMLGSAPDGKN